MAALSVFYSSLTTLEGFFLIPRTEQVGSNSNTCDLYLGCAWFNLGLNANKPESGPSGFSSVPPGQGNSN